VTMIAPTTISVSNNTLAVGLPLNLSSQLGKSGPGKLILSGANTGAGGVTLNAGTLTLSGVTPTTALGTGTLTINGGNLDVTATMTFGNNEVWNGSFGFFGTGGTLDMPGAVTMTTSIAITNFSSLRPLTVHGPITGPGYSLTKAGAGQVSLYGTNNYGNTIVSAGKLIIYTASLNTNASVSVNGGTLTLNFTTTNMVGALFSNGVSLVAGVYNNANSATILLGTGSLQVMPPPGPAGPGYLTNALNGTSLTLVWPAGQGWRLQAQTNDLNSGISNNWVYVNILTDGSYSATVNPTNPTVFYRLTYP